MRLQDFIEQEYCDGMARQSQARQERTRKAEKARRKAERKPIEDEQQLESSVEQLAAALGARVTRR